MLLHKFTCPECDTVLKSSAGVQEGKMMTCPKCEVRFQVTAEDEEPTPPPKKKSAPTPVKAKKVAPPPDDDKDEDEEEETPKRKKKKGKPKPEKQVSNVRNIVGGVILVAVLIAAAVVWINRGNRLSQKSNDGTTTVDPDDDLGKPFNPKVISIPK